ncbi:small, acid-soluble spore protein K [Cytobacillus sp. FJAT-54145]|uniref:Small, acid-soluble spore protein K n=1 Tax=Cytobacillus spartinae TaxID=3299023 RepID=A0ABW6K8P2_9BACI
MVRNKAKGFPYGNDNKFEGEPRAKAEYASKRADGSINTQPQERMRASANRKSDTSELQ